MTEAAQTTDSRAAQVHVAERIDASEVRTEPFPYLVVKDFLPTSTYRAMLAAWPPDEMFEAKNYARREQVNVGANLKTLPAETQAFWSEMLAIAAAANRALYRKFTPFFARKFLPLFGKDWREIVRPYKTSFRELQLAQYSGQAGLHPHVDSVRLVVNGFLYASERDEPDPDLGTILYRSFGFMTAENNFKMPPKFQERYLAKDVVVPYRANCLLAFVNTPFSFHGVDEFDIGKRQRRIALFSPNLTQSVEAIEADFHRAATRVET